ncbi:MAG: type II toxin-antitoxin system HipA family toxin [Thiotrichaceae bacterium]|nr:type II toxin-antitoxin system HipA family toxin [Thiotrichaceae bacterium]
MSDIDVYLKPLSPQLTARLSADKNKHVMTYHSDANEALSLTMPLRNESYNDDSLHPIFQMNLPEGALREAIERATAKRYGSDDLSMLAILGANQIGRIAYSQVGKSIASQREPSLQLEDLLKHQDAQLFSQLLSRYAQNSGVAGVQPKVLIDIQRHLTLPTQHYIVKSWENEYPHLACNEYICMDIAKRAGLNVPQTYLSDNGKLLISQRFDLDAKGNAMGFEDFCVLQGKGTKQKYDSSIEQCANTVRSYVDTEHQAKDLADLFKLTLLNISIRNGDAHLKNIGIQYHSLKNYHQHKLPEGSRKLAPFYDLVSTVPYIKNDTMALTLTGSKRWPKPKVLHAFARQHCQLNQVQITEIEEQVEQAVIGGLPLLEALQNKHHGFIEVGEVMKKLIQK